MGSNAADRLSVAAIVTVTEGPELWMDAAFLAGGARAAGFEPRRVATDFCTEEQPFQAELRALRPGCIIFPYAAEFREILLHLSRLAREAVDVPVIVAGQSLGREPEPPPFVEGITTCPVAPGSSLGDRIAGRTPGDGELSRCSFDPCLFGSGESLAARTMTASLFRDAGTMALVATRADPNALSPTALLARCESPGDGGPIALTPSAAFAPLEAVSGVERIEWWDRDLSAALGERLAEARDRGLTQSIRILPDAHAPDVLDELKNQGVHRVVFEVDRLEGVPVIEGSSASSEQLVPWARRARDVGLEVGVLLVIGLPGETRERGAARLETLRSLSPHRLRCVPFEPTGGTPAYARLKREGLLPPEGKRWNRELHRPLIQEGLDREAFLANWSDAHLLLAEVEAAR